MSLKKILLSSVLASAATLGASSMANAAANGFYVGGEAGWGNTHWSSSDLNGGGLPLSSSITSTGLAGDLFAGYQFTPNWAAELGFTQYSNAKYKNITTTIPGFGTLALGNVTVKEQSYDVMAKGMLPLDNGFGLFGKLGAALQHASASSSSFAGTNSTNKINPAAGVGVSYDVTPNVPVDVSYTRIQKMGGSIPSSDFFGVGIAYNFG